MKTLGQVFSQSLAFLEEKKGKCLKREAEFLFCHSLSIDKLSLFTDPNSLIDDQKTNELESGTMRLSNGEPLAYILGTAPFLDCDILVDSSVLIPRPETEELGELVADWMERRPPGNLLDLCCGSGCIGISMKKRFPSWNVSLSDVSRKALEIAEKNRQAQKVDVSFFEGDFFKPLKGEKWDIIVCNPPYISSEEYEKLDESVRSFEPKEALVAGENGAYFYKRFALEASHFLNQEGAAFLEIGSNQGNEVLSLFQNLPWKKVTLRKDLSGKDRFISVLI